MAYIEIGGQVNGMFRRNIIVELDKKDEAIKKNKWRDKCPANVIKCLPCKTKV